jgi:hypothetical protein
MLVGGFALVAIGCGGDGPSGPGTPSDAAPPAKGSVAAVAARAAANRPPVLVLRTTPAADTTTSPFPTISGPAPLTVRFNLCRSIDPDGGDSLNWQFDFGDGESAARDCRAEHTYREGSFVATVAVTDKHLDDQSVSALARTVQQITVDASVDRPSAPAPAPSPATAFRTVFATSTTHAGDFGGLAVADGICQARAAAAALPGSYKAWLSTSTESPSTRFTKLAGPYRLVTGTQIADNWADLTDGSLDAPINRDESGAAVAGLAWTGTMPNGTSSPGPADFVNCDGWTSTGVGLGNFGQTGNTTASNTFWTATGGWSCFDSLRLYCFQQ